MLYFLVFNSSFAQECNVLFSSEQNSCRVQMDSFSTFKFLKVNFYVFLHHGNVWSLGARSGLASQIVTRRSEFEKTVPASLPVRAAATAWGNLLLCNNGESASQSIQLPCFASLNCVYVTPMKFSHTIQKTKQWNRQCKHGSLALVPPCLPYRVKLDAAEMEVFRLWISK